MSTGSNSALFRKLPSIDEVLRPAEVQRLITNEGHTAVAEAARVVLSRVRQEIAEGRLDERALDLALSGLPEAIAREVRRALSYSLRPVINATGVILHTNLGRAPLASTAIDHIREAATAYSNLEFNLDSGERGKRDVHVDRLLWKLLAEAIPTGASGNSGETEKAEHHGLKPASITAPEETAEQAGEKVGAATSAAKAATEEKTLTAALKRCATQNLTSSAACEAVPSPISTIVVNNNAAAVLLALNSLAEGGEVIVSRGELVEIGGSFRIPDVMSKSNAVLREVGTTNRTRIGDYERAINESTRLLLRVHRSNFEITGFTEQPALDELVALARRRDIPLLEDLGSGALFELRTVGISDEPGVLDSLRAGVDVVTYSGDKLLGGPQAGLISGRADLVAKMRSNSLFRALRVDKLTYAALETTLLAYIKHDYDAVPTLRMMRLPKDEISRRAEALLSKMSAQSRGRKLKLELCDGESVVGGGAAPSATLPTRLIALTHGEMSADELLARLRASDPPVIARVDEGRVLLDLRTVFPEQDNGLAAACISLQ